MDVPESVKNPLVSQFTHPLLGTVDFIELPGANKSVMLFLLLKLEMASAFVTEPMAVAFLMHAGEDIAVVLPLFPAATTTDIFLDTALSIAVLNADSLLWSSQ